VGAQGHEVLDARLVRPGPTENCPIGGDPEILSGRSEAIAGCELVAADMGGAAGKVVGRGVEKRLPQGGKWGELGIALEKLREPVRIRPV
jgi:hypothetical protein